MRGNMPAAVIPVTPLLRPRPLVSILLALLLAGCTGTGLLNAFTPESGYRVAEGIVYDAEHRLHLDVYTPQQAARAPVVVFFYGGRWEEGTPEDFRFVGLALASQGFVAVLPDYRHYPAVRFPAFVEDAARAVRWTQDQVARYGGDARKIFVMGHSSGAHLAAMLALDPAFLRGAGVERSRIRGMIGLAGPYDFLPLTAADLRDMFGPPERYELSQPIAYVDGENPPLLLLHGADDDNVGVHNTKNLAAVVARRGGPVEVHIYPEMSHSWIVATLAAPLRGRSDVLERVADFVLRQSTAKPKPQIEGKAIGER
jgi:acetyl esterase/lipase